MHCTSGLSVHPATLLARRRHSRWMMIDWFSNHFHCHPCSFIATHASIIIGAVLAGRLPRDFVLPAIDQTLLDPSHPSIATLPVELRDGTFAHCLACVHLSPLDRYHYMLDHNIGITQLMLTGSLIICIPCSQSLISHVHLAGNNITDESCIHLLQRLSVAGSALEVIDLSSLCAEIDCHAIHSHTQCSLFLRVFQKMD